MSSKTIDLLRRLIAERPDDFETRIHLAGLLIEGKRGDEALQVLEEALALKPEDPGALRMYAGLCYERHSYEDACERLLKAARVGPPDPRADMLLSRVYLELGEFGKAETKYHDAVKADPSLEDAYYLESIRSGGQRKPVLVKPGEPRGLPQFQPDEGAITFADVGGMVEVKEHLRMSIILPLQKPELFRTYGKRVGGGILLFGPPGCGKTFIARALAGECSAKFYSVGIYDILDKYLGSSERNVHALFEEARRNAPAVVFIDEIDALGLKRSTSEWGTALRGSVNTLLAEMDKLGDLKRPVLLVGATNTPWNVDPAMRRPGRFDRVIFVPPPDEEARSEILALCLAGKPTEDVDLAEIASRLHRFSGADIRALVDRAVEDALKKAMNSNKVERITTANLLETAKGMRPSTEEWLATARDYVRYSNQAGLYDQVKAYLESGPE